MKTRSLGILLSVVLLNSVPAADVSQLVAGASLYESGFGVESLRQIEQAVHDSAGNAAARAKLEAALAKMLAPSATFEARRFACVQLAIIGTESCLSAVAALLNTPETTGIACLALGSNPSAKVNELLRAALPAASGTARVQIIVTLGDRADAAAVKPLIEFTRSAEPATVEAAIGSLGKIASEEALTALASLRQRGDPEQVRTAARASLVAADIVARRGDRAAAVPIYDQLLAAAQPAQVRRAALEALLRLDADGGEKRALQVLRGDDSALKPSAIACVRTLKSADASATFAKEMAKLTPSQQALLIESLAARNDPAARAAVTDQVSAADATVRQAAVMALARIGDVKSVPVLAKALNAATNVPEQQTLEMALASLQGGDEVDKQIAALLQTKLTVPKPGLINVLARRGNSVVVPALLVEADSTDPATAKAAFRALGKLVTLESLPVLVEKLAKLKAPDAQGAAEAAVAQALAKVSDAGRRSETVLDVLVNRAKTVDARCSVIALLPACGDENSLVAARTARADKEPRIREAALRALGDWPNAAAWESLSEAYRQPENDAQRVIALRGLVRLAGEQNAGPSVTLVDRYRQLLDGAKTDGDRKLILGTLAGCAHPKALALALPLLDNAAVKAEAASAVKKIATAIKATHPKEAQEALNRVK